MVDRAWALEQDLADPLARFRAEFAIEPGLLYLDGNSLGRMPLRAAQALRSATEHSWAARLVRGWNDGWIDLPQRVGEKIALTIGAVPGTTVCCDSTSVNLYKLAAACEPARIVTHSGNFPSDVFVLSGIAQTVVSDDPVAELREGDLLSLSHVEFKSGRRWDIEQVECVAAAKGARVLWDLSHSVGAVPLELDSWGARLAVGCTYKYLNGGPGAPAFLYVRNPEHLRSPIQGWFGHARPFEFDLGYEPAGGIERFLAGTPPVLSMVAVDAALDLVNEAGAHALWAKAVALTEMAMEMVDGVPELELITPRNSAERGSHLSYRHPEAWRINRCLIERHQVIPDFRAPDVLRLGFTPLYLSFVEAYDAVERLVSVVRTGEWREFEDARPMVT